MVTSLSFFRGPQRLNLFARSCFVLETLIGQFSSMRRYLFHYTAIFPIHCVSECLEPYILVKVRYVLSYISHLRKMLVTTTLLLFILIQNVGLSMCLGLWDEGIA